MFPVIVCIAKLEEDYIEEFVKYHLALGFEHIFIYDNEDEPKYEKILEKYKRSITVFHIPGKYNQYNAYYHFINEILFKNEIITHVAIIDIDEFIVLKQHNNICDFINEFIKDDCEGIAMNWRFFGSSNKKEKENIPITERFTLREKDGNIHIKTLFKKDNLKCLNTMHDIILNKGYIKTTAGDIVIGPFNDKKDYNYIQLNHYKCKTLEEFKYIITRGNAANNIYPRAHLTIEEEFKLFDYNEEEDLYAYNFYKNIK